MREDTKKMILDVAGELAVQYGFWSFRVEDILQHAHISRATFYKYFKNREDVLHTLYDARLDAIDSDIRAAVAKAPGSYDRLRIFMIKKITGMTDLFTTLNIRIGEAGVAPLLPRERIEKENEKDLMTIREVLSIGKQEGDVAFDDLFLTARVVLGITREIGFKATFENKDIWVIEREVNVMLGALFSGISCPKKQQDVGRL